MAKLLVVEDNAFIAKQWRRILEREGHEVIAAENGALGLDAFRADQFSLILTDVDMPVMNGVEMATIIKAESPNCRIIMITSNLLASHPADELLVKPFHPTKLIEIVNRLLA